MSDALERDLLEMAEGLDALPVPADLFRKAAAELARLREALAQAERERDEARQSADGMARAPYGEFEKMRVQRDAAEADLAACREQEAQAEHHLAAAEPYLVTTPNGVMNANARSFVLSRVRAARAALAEAAATLTEPEGTGTPIPPVTGGREAEQSAASSGSVSAEAAATKEQA